MTTDHPKPKVSAEERADRFYNWLDRAVIMSVPSKTRIAFLVSEIRAAEDAAREPLEQKVAELQADLRNALALLRYCFDGDDIPVIYTVEELREWVKGDSGQGAIAAAKEGEKDGE